MLFLKAHCDRTTGKVFIFSLNDSFMLKVPLRDQLATAMIFVVLVSSLFKVRKINYLKEERLSLVYGFGGSS